MKKEKITPQKIDYLANLSRIEMSSEEKILFAEQLGEILGYLDKLNQIPTDNITARFYLQNITNRLREDKVEDSLKIEEVLKNAPEKENNFFKTPKIIE